MNPNKQLINLVGILAAVVILVLGGVLIALPMYSQAQALDANTASVSQTNATLQAQVDALTAAQEREDEIDTSLAALRTEIPSAADVDDLHEIIAGAAGAADIRVVSITAEDPEPWVARAAVDADGKAVAPAPEPAPTDSAGSEDGATADAPATDGADPGAAPAPVESPQQQVLLTVVMDLTQPFQLVATDPADAVPADPAADQPDPASVRADQTALSQKAAAFVDALGRGPRLLSPIDVDFTKDGTLTISILTYIRTEDAQ